MAQDNTDDAPAARWRPYDGPHPQSWVGYDKDASEWDEDEKDAEEWTENAQTPTAWEEEDGAGPEEWAYPLDESN